MDTVQVIHDREGQSLTVWFGDPGREHSSAADDNGVVVIKDRDNRVLGVEILNFNGNPGAVSFAPAAARRAPR